MSDDGMTRFERSALISCIATLQGVRELVDRIEPKCFTELKMIDESIELAQIAERVHAMREAPLRRWLTYLLLGTKPLFTYNAAYDDLSELGLVLPKDDHDKTCHTRLSPLGIKVAQRLLLEREGVDV